MFGLQALLAFLLVSEAPGQSWARRVLAPAVLWTASIVLFHQAAVLFSVPLIVYALLGGPDRLRNAVQISVLSGATSLLIYVAVYTLTDHEGARDVASGSVSGFIRWTLLYATLDLGWGSASNLTATGLRNVVGSVLANIVTASGPSRMLGYAAAAAFVAAGFLWNAVAVLRGATVWRDGCSCWCGS